MRIEKMSKVPQRDEIWKNNDREIFYYIVSVDKNSIRCLIKENERYSIFSINKYDFVTHRHYVGISRIDVKDIFERVNYD